MIFTKGIKILRVTDPAHISCLRAKGWKEQKEQKEEPQTPTDENGGEGENRGKKEKQ